MLKNGLAVTGLWALTVLAAQPASAAAQDFTLHNLTGHVITHIYISEIGNDVWKDDVLGKQMLNDGEATPITFSGFPDGTCEFDVKVVVDGDSSWVVQNIDLCKINHVAFSVQDENIVYTQE